MKKGIYMIKIEGKILEFRTSPDGDYDYSVTKSGYVSNTGSVTIDGEDITENVVLEEVEYETVFVVVDADESPISGATVSINEETLTTDSEGKATISLEDGEYPYTVSKTNYNTVEDTVTVVDEAQTVNVTLELTTYSVTFNVQNSSEEPLEGATVTINEETLTTDETGACSIDLVPETYEYSVSMTGYTTVTDSVTIVDEDILENVELETEE